MKKSIYILFFAFFTFSNTALLAAARQMDIPVPVDSMETESDRTRVLKRGTLVQLRTAEIINSKEVNVGDLVEMNVHIDIKVDNDVVLKTNNFATARVKKVRQAGKFGRGAFIELEATNVRTVDGQLIRLEGGQIVEKGDARRSLAWAASIIPTTVFLAVNPFAAPLFIGFGLFMKGKEAIIKQGAMMTARVLEDTKVRA